ncbi:MAG: anthranilate synthase component I [candidate division WOR-3 bacterium]
MTYLEFERYIKKEGPMELHLVRKDVLADLETPLSYYLKVRSQFDEGPSFLFESAERKEVSGRYSIIGFEPYLVFKAAGHKVKLSGMIEDEIHVENPFDVLKRIVSGLKVAGSYERITAGAFGYVSYDLVRFFEKIPDIKVRKIGCYDMYFLFPSMMVIFDNYTGRLSLVTASPERAESEDAIRELRVLLRLPIPSFKRRAWIVEKMEQSVSKERFENMVRIAKEYIANGDAIQVVLSQRFVAAIDAESTEIYRALRLINPSPYMFLIDFPEYSLIGSSPETMVKMKEGVIYLRPIAGTRKRGSSKDEDDRLEKDLLTDQKELAEHVMLVDLARNDVGRVARIGSVNVEQFMQIEKYSHVMHIVSSVKGIVKDGLDAFDVFASCFPAGTVTGAPKIRAMEIIEELEEEKREFYAGATGYFLLNGDMDFCITIRSLLKQGNTLYIQAGAGIVADSVPENEYHETINKAKAIMATLEGLREILP